MTKDPHADLKDFMLDDHAQAIGYVCIWWSQLEARLDSFLAYLIGLEIGKISESITANADMREKVQMIIALAFIQKRNVAWFERVKTLMDSIDNILRVERNRYIHDAWVIQAAKTIRRTRGTKIKRPQAFKIELVTKEDVEIKPGQIWQLVVGIEAAVAAIARLTLERAMVRSPMGDPIQVYEMTSPKK